MVDAAVAGVLFRVPLPTTAASWATLGWVWLLGLAGSAMLGIALSRVPRTGRSATAVIVPVVLVLQFVSGIIPLTYFLVVVRGIVIKGVGIPALAPQIGALAIFGVVLIVLAAARFRKRLD